VCVSVDVCLCVLHVFLDSFIPPALVFLTQALADAADMRARLDTLLASHGLPSTTVADEDLARFCKNANNLALVSYVGGAECLSTGEKGGAHCLLPLTVWCI
jgi:hypothetical protein